MTLVLDTPATREAPAASLGLAQVNLLPPEIRARRALKRLSRWLVAGLSALVLGLAGGYYAATLQVDTAREELAAAQSGTARLTDEQLAYTEVPTVLSQVSSLQEARSQGFSTEIAWTPYLGAVLAVLPDGVELTSVDITGATPMLAAAPPMDPLQDPSLSRLSLTARSATLPDTAAWLDGLSSVPGFSDAWVSGATLGSDPERGTYYEVTASVQVTQTALAHRFDGTEDN